MLKLINKYSVTVNNLLSCLFIFLQAAQIILRNNSLQRRTLLFHSQVCQFLLAELWPRRTNNNTSLARDPASRQQYVLTSVQDSSVIQRKCNTRKSFALNSGVFHLLNLHRTHHVHVWRSQVASRSSLTVTCPTAVFKVLRSNHTTDSSVHRESHCYLHSRAHMTKSTRNYRAKTYLTQGFEKEASAGPEIKLQLPVTLIFDLLAQRSTISCSCHANHLCQFASKLIN